MKQGLNSPLGGHHLMADQLLSKACYGLIKRKQGIVPNHALTAERTPWELKQKTPSPGTKVPWRVGDGCPDQACGV